jgi:hypothetical protein
MYKLTNVKKKTGIAAYGVITTAYRSEPTAAKIASEKTIT